MSGDNDDDLDLFDPEVPEAGTGEATVQADAPADTATPDKPAGTPGEDAPAKLEAPAGEVKTVPLGTFIDLRLELKDAKDKLKKFEGNDTSSKVPDPKTNPTEYAQYQEENFNMRILNERMNVSERFAIKEHGKEKVTKAFEWAMSKFEQDKVFADRIIQDPDPYGAAIEEFEREELNKEMTPENIAKFKEWQKAQAAGGSTPAPANGAKIVSPAANVAAKPQQAQAPIPKSIVDQPSAGGHQGAPAVSSVDVFESAFSG